jgi:hypothetical protein
MSSIEEIVKLHPEFVKKLEIPVLSAKTVDSEDGKVYDSDTWQKAILTFEVMPIPQNATSFLMVHYPRSKLTGKLGYVMVYRVSLTGIEEGWSMGALDTQNAENEFIDLKVSDIEDISEEKATELWLSKKFWVRERKGKSKDPHSYQQPCVETVRIQR